MLTPARVQKILIVMDTSEGSATALELLKLSPEQAAERIDRLPLAQRVDLVLSVPAGRQRMELILLSAKAEELVQAIAPEDLVLTIKHVGDQDALPLLELSSDEQFGYLLDLEIWVRDGMDLGRLHHWLTLLLECDNQRVLRWLRAADFELLVLLFERTLLQVDQAEAETFPDLLSGRVITPDGTHFLLVKLGADFTLIRRLVHLIYAEEQPLFFALTGNLGTTPAAEIEELVRRWKDGRLSDRGWPDLDEALALYQPAEPGRVPAVSPLPIGLANPPRYPLERRHPGKLLEDGIRRLDHQDLRGSVGSQLANLINRVVVADGMETAEIESLARATERVGGRLEIGLSLLGATDAASSANLLGSIALLDIFRVAQGAILKRVERIRVLKKSPAADLLPLLSAPYPERLSALLAQRPLFLPDEQPEPGEFRDASDLAALDRDLELIEASIRLAEALNISHQTLPDPFPPGCFPGSIEGLFLDALLLTAFARQQAGLKTAAAPFPFEALPALFERLPREPNRLSEVLRDWAARRLDGKPPGLERLVGNLAQLLLDQLLSHDPNTVDPRFVEGLWLELTPDRR